MERPRTVVILPALDEEGAVGDVVRGFLGLGAEVLVVDNGSTDATARRARAAGARVVHEPRRGYGSACLAGIEALRARPPHFVAFADCDGSVDPADLAALTKALQDGADLALGDRRRLERGAMPLRNRMARWACVAMFFVCYGRRLRDLPPLRAVRWHALQGLPLEHPTYGFPVETVGLAIRRGLRIVEVPVHYRRRRAGHSKVGAGGLVDALRVGWVMAATTIRVRFRRMPA